MFSLFLIAEAPNPMKKQNRGDTNLNLKTVQTTTNFCVGFGASAIKTEKTNWSFALETTVCFFVGSGALPLQLKQRKQTVVSSAKLQFVFPLGLVPPKYTKKNSMLSNLIDNLFFRMVCFVGFVFGIGRLQTKSQT